VERDSSLAAAYLQLGALEVVQARRRSTDPAWRNSVDVVVELIERLLKLRVAAHARPDFDELAARGLNVMAMRRNVGEVRICLAPRHKRQNRGDTSYGAES